MKSILRCETWTVDFFIFFFR